MNLITKLFDLSKKYSYALISLIGFFLIALSGLENLEPFWKDTLLNLGSGFVGTGIVSMILSQLFKYEAEHSEKNWHDRIDKIVEKASLSNKANLSHFAGSILQEIGLLGHKTEIEAIVRHSVFNTRHLDYPEEKSKRLIGAFVEPKKDLSGSKKINYGINSMLLTSEPKSLERLVSDMNFHIRNTSKINNIQILRNSAIVTPKKGNPILASYLANLLNVPIIFFNDRDDYSAEHFEGDLDSRKHFIIVHDIVESGKRIIDLGQKVKDKTGYDIEHAFVFVERSDNIIPKMYGSNSGSSIKIYPLHCLCDAELIKLKDECVTS